MAKRCRCEWIPPRIGLLDYKEVFSQLRELQVDVQTVHKIGLLVDFEDILTIVRHGDAFPLECGAY
jgi:hypothetical protein